jgi:hypothetical protein
LAEHVIRFRGGWECHGLGGAAGNARRLTLPTVWNDGSPARMRLTRRFGCPPLEPGCQALSLRMDQVPGIDSLELNGRSIARVSPQISSYRIELGELTERNLLVLEFDRSTPASESWEGRQWGVIALVISSVDD